MKQIMQYLLGTGLAEKYPKIAALIGDGVSNANIIGIFALRLVFTVLAIVTLVIAVQKFRLHQYYGGEYENENGEMANSKTEAIRALILSGVVCLINILLCIFVPIG